MKRSPMKRKPYTFKHNRLKSASLKRTKGLRKVAPKRRAINAEAADWRREHCSTVGACDLCESDTIDLCCHEIPRANRVNAFNKACAVLVLCDVCHRQVHDRPKKWTKLVQAALLLFRREQAFDLAGLNLLLTAKLELSAIEAVKNEIHKLLAS